MVGITVAVLCCTASQSYAVVFTNVTQSSGVNYHQWDPPQVPRAALRMSGGAAAADFDNDGWTDLFVTRLDNTDILFRNDGDGTFSDVSASAGFNQSFHSNGATWADIDNDGDQDLYVTTLLDGGKRNHLYVNDGNGSFAEQAMVRGADTATPQSHTGFGSTFGDYDGDGYLDLFTVEWTTTPGDENTRLLRNLGAANPGYFEDTTLAAGIDVSVGSSQAVTFAFAPTFADMDRDGHVDLVVAGDFGSSQLLWNNGDGTFTNGTVPGGVGTDENGMGSAVGDYDGDGDLDWFVSSIYEDVSSCAMQSCNWQDSGNRLFQNNGDRTFNDVTDAAGVREGGWGWGAAFVDYDNDGDLDLTHTNGIDFDNQPLDAAFNVDQTRLWQNDAGVFTDVATQSGITDIASGKGLLTFDYDNDGDQDLFIANNAGQPILYRNDGGNANDWLRIRTVGTESNADGVGAQITVTPDDATPGEFIYREVTAGSNFLGQNEVAIHIGLGDFSGTIDRVTVEWPATGVVQVLEDVSPNALLTVVEPMFGLDGDFNGDGIVDAADFTVWRDHFGNLDESVLNNNGDGINGVDAADLTLWRTNFGAGSSVAFVPEPGVQLLGLVIAYLLVFGRRRRGLARRA